MSLSKLEGQKGILRILTFILDKGETNFQRIVDQTDMYDRIVRNSLPILRELELISTRIDKSTYPYRNMISLTDKGKKVAEKLKEIEEIIAR